MYDTDDNRAERTNILALASVALGTVAMGLQPLGCCLPVFAPLVVFCIGCAGLGLGVAGYRQSDQSNLNGYTASVVGLTLGALNTVIALCWCVGSALMGSLTLIGTL